MLSQPVAPSSGPAGFPTGSKWATVRGTAGNPMTREEMITKARDLIVPVLGADKFQKLSDKIFALETVKNVAELRPLLQTA